MSVVGVKDGGEREVRGRMSTKTEFYPGGWWGNISLAPFLHHHDVMMEDRWNHKSLQCCDWRRQQQKKAASSYESQAFWPGISTDTNARHCCCRSRGSPGPWGPLGAPLVPAVSLGSWESGTYWKHS